MGEMGFGRGEKITFRFCRIRFKSGRIKCVSMSCHLSSYLSVKYFWKYNTVSHVIHIHVIHIHVIQGAAQEPGGFRNEIIQDAAEKHRGFRNEIIQGAAEKPYGFRNAIIQVAAEKPDGFRNEIIQ